MIPEKYTCDNEREEYINPPLEFDGLPGETETIALIMDDPDAQNETFTHWVVWDIDRNVRKIGEAKVPEGGVQGINSAGRLGYIGPCPPEGKHRYFFHVYALDTTMELPLGSHRAQLETNIKGHVLDEGETMGTYERKD